MHKQKTKLFLALIAGICMLSFLSFTGCESKKESSTETKVDSTMIDTPVMILPDSSQMQKMDTGDTKPIVPGS